ncbi:MAG: ScpA family protein [Methylocystis sp.]|jgi:segregation and condensation protein A
MARQLAFEATERPERGETEPAFLVDVDGFEGPLDLLLELARRQKVDLSRISILALAEQYLAFVDAARRVRLELAADYLVMAAWLAYLKSRLLLPEQPKGGEEPSAADLASALADRLRRLEAIRRAADQLTDRARLGRDMFLRGAGEGIETSSKTNYRASLFDLLSAYARQRQKSAISRVTLRQRTVWSLADAREALERLAGAAMEWTVLDDYLLQYCVDLPTARTVRASAFSASLEMVREGRFDLRQDRAFSTIWLRRREEPVADPAPFNLEP